MRQMNDQPTFADMDYTSERRKTRQEKFPERTDSLIPRQRQGRANLTPLPPSGAGAPVLSFAGDAAGAYRPAVLQPKGPCDGRPAVRSGAGTALCRTEIAGTDPRRDHHPPPPHLLDRHHLGRGLFEEIKGTLKSMECGRRRGPSWTPPSSQPRRRPRIGPIRGTRICAR